MPFAPEYIRLVLNENFEDAKALFLDALMAIHYGHLAMLAEQGIIDRADARAIRAALDGIDLAAVRQTAYDGVSEDLFFHLNQLIAARCGAEVAGVLHTARSRNDIDMTLYRMQIRQWVLMLADASLALRRSLIGVAERHRETVFPAHTHGQPAQPTTLAHYLLAMVEQLERDARRLVAAYVSTNRSPLGACAITGTGFPIDRDRTSALLGFFGPTGNTYGSIATVDYMMESTSAASTLVLGVGRFVQDMLLWSTVEMGYLRLPDELVQKSSIMPQKRNPVALEHTRAIASRALGELHAAASAAHNTPFGDIVDTEDDLQPLMALAFRDATRATSLLAVTMAVAEFNVPRMRARAAEGWASVTELADVLARDHGVPFVIAHDIVSRFVRTVADVSVEGVGERLAEAARGCGRQIHYTDDALRELLSPEHFVAVRRTHGGPAVEVIAAALVRSHELLREDERELSGFRQSLAGADVERRAAVDRL